MSVVVMRRAASTALEVVLALCIAAAVLVGVIRPMIGAAGLALAGGPFFGKYPGVSAAVDLERVRVATSPELPSLAERGEVFAGDALELTIPHDTTVAVYHPDLTQFLGLVGPQILGGLLATIVLVLLLRIVRTLRTGDPFVPDNAARLYLIAGVVGIGGQAAVLLRAWGERAVLSHPAVADYVLDDVQISLLPLVAGLGVAVAAEVFRQGAALRKDLEGVV